MGAVQLREPVIAGTELLLLRRRVPLLAPRPRGFGASARRSPNTHLGRYPQEQLSRFRQDGLVDLPETLVKAFPNNAWIVSVHQRNNGNFHLRRLDADGWSEKRGDYAATSFHLNSWQELIDAVDEDCNHYEFSGFFVASNFITWPCPYGQPSLGEPAPC